VEGEDPVENVCIDERDPTILEPVTSHWPCRAVVVDATGVGGGLAAFLGAALGPHVVTPFVYTAASKAKLAYDFLAAINAGRLKVHQPPLHPTPRDAHNSPPIGPNRSLVDELLRQCAAAEYALRAHQTMAFFVPDARGHDDLLNALALLTQAAPLGRLRTAAGSTPRKASNGENRTA
jgi:hypothetical protein